MTKVVSILLRLSVMSTALVLSSGYVGSAAKADVGTPYCAHGAHAGATACVTGLRGERYIGGYDNFSDLQMTDTNASLDQGNHVNNEMWLYTHADESQFVEIGLRFGVVQNQTQCCYARFWADWDSIGVEHFHLLAWTASTGANHSYEIQRDGSNPNYWDVYVDYTFMGQSTNQGSNLAYEIQNGIEDTDVTPNTYAAVFTHSPLEYQATNGAFYYYPYQARWIDDSCATHPVGYCLGFNYYTTHDWEDSKP